MATNVRTQIPSVVVWRHATLQFLTRTQTAPHTRDLKATHGRQTRTEAGLFAGKRNIVVQTHENLLRKVNVRSNHTSITYKHTQMQREGAFVDTLAYNFGLPGLRRRLSPELF